MREFKPQPLDVNEREKQAHADNWRATIEDVFGSEKPAETVRGSDKWFRVTTSDVAHGTDWMLKLAANFGWGLFDPSLHRELPIYERPRATVSWDSGPDMLCLTMYLQNHKKLRMTSIMSILHGSQRALWGGVHGQMAYDAEDAAPDAPPHVHDANIHFSHALLFINYTD